MKSSSGSYILFIRNNENNFIKISKLGNILFDSGIYAYICSAMNHQLYNRVYRHSKPPHLKKKHWHIDFFLADPHVHIIKIWLFPSELREECCVSHEIAKYANFAIPKFGATDCKCTSHFFYFGINLPSFII